MRPLWVVVGSTVQVWRFTGSLDIWQDLHMCWQRRYIDYLVSSEEICQPALVQHSKSTRTFGNTRTIKMPALPQFDYIFAIGTIFAFLDAWNIGTSSLL
jgi:hypothetical protein